MRTTLVTGATDGIGLATALELGRRQHRVLVHGRSQAKAEAAIGVLRQELPEAWIEPVWGDLSSLAQVRDVASQALALGGLNGVVHNAGVYETERNLTVDGFETTYAVHHLAPFLLTHLLLPSLSASGEGRIATVSSVAHTRGKIDWDNLQGERDFNAYKIYATSKLLNVLFTFELARRAPATVAANVLHPGVITTKLLKKGFNATGDSTEVGARTSVFLVDSPKSVTGTGLYFSDSKVAHHNPQADDVAACERLWNLSWEQCGL